MLKGICFNNLFKENFYRKKKKKVINVLINFFFIFYKSGDKTFLNELLINTLRALVSMTKKPKQNKNIALITFL